MPPLKFKFDSDQTGEMSHGEFIERFKSNMVKKKKK